jgi:hypothetical protein
LEPPARRAFMGRTSGTEDAEGPVHLPPPEREGDHTGSSGRVAVRRFLHTPTSLKALLEGEAAATRDQWGVAIWGEPGISQMVRE